MSPARMPRPLDPAHLRELLLADPTALGGMADPLLNWYDQHARDLPWRRDTSPYRVWVSEIMLQQTRVEAVKGYFVRFMEALPTVEDLAQAPTDRLLKLWEGLGYYTRARNLQKAAQIVCEKYGGALPASYAQLLELPGIGEYTAGAVASIAFGIAVPAVDGNVYRVLSRLMMSPADTSAPAVKQAFRQLAAGLVPAARPGDFNQALMELGATVCLPNGPPLCEACPLQHLCAGARAGKEAAMTLPVKAAKKARRTEERTVLFLINPAGELLLFRRGEAGLLPGLYEPVNLEGHLSREQSLAAIRSLGADPHRLLPLRRAKHIFSHVEWHMKGYLAYLPSFDTPAGIWVGRRALEEDYALPSAFSAYTRDLPLWMEQAPTAGNR